MRDETTTPGSGSKGRRRGWRRVGAVLLAVIGLWFFLLPGVTVLRCIFDPALNGPGVPKAALALHRSLAGRYEAWARERVAAGTAEHLSVSDISGTEWPLFGSVFYLRAVESLQAAWEKDPQLTREEPRVFARGAIEAATALVADPKHAAWVKKYWGERYLEEGNLFYRMLLISALTSHARLTQSGEHLALLRTQVESLAAEIDASPPGLLDDYPGQCYPTDVGGAIAAIRRADAVLGTDHRAFAERAVRGFEGARAGALGLAPYAADALTGTPRDDSRGCGNSWLTLSAPELWPDRAAAWYAAYEQHFWQDDWLAKGFREFPRGIDFCRSYHTAWRALREPTPRGTSRRVFRSLSPG